MERLGDILKRTGPPERPDGVGTRSGAEGITGTASCPRCQGRGWLSLDVPASHPRFGEVVPCPCRQQELGRQKQDRLQQYSNLGPLALLTFATLVAKGRSASPENQALFAQALEAARSFAGAPKGWLVLVGVSGCGKTHLAAAVANQRLSRGEAAFFASVPDLLDHLRSAFSPVRPDEASYDALFEQVRATPLLVLDDLGTQSTTPWAREKLFQVLNHRYVAQLATVVTALTLDDMEERWRSRLSDPNILFGRKVWEVGRRELPLFQQVGGVDLTMLAAMTFDSFDTKNPGGGDAQARESLHYAFRAAKEFAEAPEGWLVLLGGTGCGKTHLAAAIANYSLRRGQPVFFVSVPDLLDHFRSLFSPDSRQSYDHVFEEVRRVPLLILDDFGVHTGTPWAQEKLYQILNYRYAARLPTVITSPLEEAEMDAPFGSRMVDPRVSTVIRIGAPDYRAGRAGASPAPPRPRGRLPRRG